MPRRKDNERFLKQITQLRYPHFLPVLKEHETDSLVAKQIDVLQINVGKVCNQTCRHCHVDAGPERREMMTRETCDAILKLLEQSEIGTLDITGGAPEMNPHFRYLVEEARHLERHVIDRCNLTILMANGYADLPEFLADHQVEIIASLPCYLEDNCDSQRGDGVFRQSVAALRRLNALGYGESQSSLQLNLVYNPIGPSLPPDQEQLENDYRRELRQRYNIEFTKLYTITNLPVSRFLSDLLSAGRYDEYMQKLVESYNPKATESVMCRTMLSVDWQGNFYDCDFNQMLDIPICATSGSTVFDCNLEELSNRTIGTGRHCFGCTAGSGSSCGGTLIIEAK